jgi:alkyldihydroxyacetonephosphate synthase
MARREMRWFGWGDPAHVSHGLPDGVLELLRARVGLADVPRPPFPAEAIRLPAPVEFDIPGVELRTDHEARLLRAGGKSYADLVRMRSGELEAVPDAVAVARSAADVRAVLAAGVAVVPFGGGTSVVGGLDALRGDHPAVVSLDLGMLARLLSVDERSRVAVFDPGIQLPAAEGALNAQGFTLGHFPQSYEYATVGGCVATRSAGQASTGYGRIDDLVVGLEAVTPAGDVSLAAVPASAAGPDLRELFVGSEGALGVLTRVTLRIRPLPAERRYEGFMVASFEEGCEALRALEQQGAAPHVARLSDSSETEVSFALAGRSGVTADLASRYLRARGVAGGCLVILGWEGTLDRVEEGRAMSVAVLRRHGAVSLGRSPGRAWSRSRFDGPYLRDDLLERGVMAETLETATTWSNLGHLYEAVGDALRAHAPVVMCHVSHLYETGASLYFTFIARQHDGAELEQWRDAKTAACEAIGRAGGTITHHHAVGRDHAPYLEHETSRTGLAALRAVKSELDPDGIMNPGKLLPETEGTDP